MLKVVDGVLGDTSEDLLKNASKYTGTPKRYVHMCMRAECTYVLLCVSRVSAVQYVYCVAISYIGVYVCMYCAIYRTVIAQCYHRHIRTYWYN